MRLDRRIASGVVLGLTVAVASFPATPQRPGHGPLLSECDGAIRELVIQYVPEAKPTVGAAYRDFLIALPAEVTVRVVCPDRAAFDELRTIIGPVACRLEPVVTGHAMTCWARDRWLALGPAAKGPTILLSPAAEDGEEVWPARAGDRRIGEDLARALRGIEARRSPLAFDGGDFAADGETVFVSPRVGRRNPGLSEEALRNRLDPLLGRKVVLLRDAPDHHVAMYMALTGNRTALVGDPSLARAILGDGAGDASRETQARFDAVARAVAAAGYRVVRIPVAPGADGRSWLTPTNAIMDERDGERAVYLPVFRHAEPLNRAATRIWESLGYTVRRVDCTETFSHFGSIHCLVNVLRRGELNGQ